jgi:hypothetical protein
MRSIARPVMAGDGQMDPAELEGICTPVIQDGIDYVKGNRLIHRSAWLVIPRVRFFGNSILSILTKLASGYWRVSDTQTGFTAISLKALNAVKLHKIYRSYGMPNDMLVKLNIAQCTLKEVEIKPIYRVGEQSKMKIFKVIPRVSLLLIRCFLRASLEEVPLPRLPPALPLLQLRDHRGDHHHPVRRQDHQGVLERHGGEHRTADRPSSSWPPPVSRR